MALFQISQPVLKESGENTWYVEYQEIYKNGKVIRRKPTFNINRIKDLDDRRDEAHREINKLCAKFGLDSSLISIQKKSTSMTLHDAIVENCAIQIRTYTKEGTIRTYQNMNNQLCKYLKLKKMDRVAAKDWSALHVKQFFDYLKIEHRTPTGTVLKNRTINNYKKELVTIFNDLIGRGYVKENHFVKVEKMKKTESKYKVFDENERDVVYKEIIKTDPVLAFAVTLIYRCAIRSYKEMVSLKPSSFKLKEGYILIKGEDSKANGADQFVTIPDDLLFYFANFIKDIPQDYYIFGAGAGTKPHKTKVAGKNTLYTRHRIIVENLEKEGRIKDASKHPLYLWKKDGAFLLIDAGVDIHTLKEHFRHDDITTTACYFTKRYQVQPKIKAFSAGIVPM